MKSMVTGAYEKHWSYVSIIFGLVIIKKKNNLRAMTELLFPDSPKAQAILPLSPRKQFENAANIPVLPLSPRRLLESPLKTSTSKSSPAKLSVKGLSVKKALAENSPVKRSPILKLHRQDGEILVV